MNNIIAFIFYFLKNIILLFIILFEFLIICRMIFSLFFNQNNNKIYNYIYNITELLLAPIRNLIYKLPFLSALPIDISTILCFIILNRLKSILI